MALRTWSSQPVERGLSFADVLALPKVEEHVELRGRFGFMAFHGGNLERRTDWIAWEAAERSDASVYSVSQPPGTRHHFPSATVSPAHSDRLRGFMDHCEVVITVHGFGRHGHWDNLLLGGQNRALADHTGEIMRESLPERYNVVTDIDAIPRSLRGLHPDNPVNQPTAAGMQLELPPGIRGLTPAANSYPAPFPHLEVLIDALARSACTFPF
jgi:phage replication-related protein YjqB (UPF0714/DUF867 family)